MQIMGSYNLMTVIFNTTTEVLNDFKEPIMFACGAVLAFVIIDVVIAKFQQAGDPSITVGGKTLHVGDINNESVMPMSWYKSLSYEDQKRISDFDHEQARKKYSKMTQE